MNYKRKPAPRWFPDERINAALADYQKQLSGSPYGWKGIIYPGGG
eukprot:gene6207-7905_t